MLHISAHMLHASLHMLYKCAHIHYTNVDPRYIYAQCVRQMEDDPVMAADNRNIALVGLTDGVCFFKDLHRGCWPFVFRVANLPDGLSVSTRNTHVGMLSANEYFSTDPVSGQVVRYVRGPKSLHPHMLIICDDLYSAYHTGNNIIDWTIPMGVPGRSFCCRTTLLFWTGDYPALAKCSGMKHKGRRLCHWCEIETHKDKAMQRQVVSQYRRFLHTDDPKRGESWTGGTEQRPQPEHRTHIGMVQQAKANLTHEGYENAAPHHETGITELSPLSHLPGFDLCWDFAPDMFHIVEGVFQSHIVPMLKGKRRPKMPKRTANVSNQQWKKIQQSFEREKARVRSWELPKKVLRRLDERSRVLGGETGWFNSGRAICKRTGSLKAHDWVKIAEGAWQYIFHGLYNESPNQQESLYEFLSALSAILGACSHADNVDVALDIHSTRTDMSKLKKKVVNAMALFDREFPMTEKAGVFHIILHVPDFIYRWGSVRNGWCFYGERVIGWLMRFIKNRDMAVESIVMALGKNSAVCQLPPGVIGTLRARIAAAGISLPKGSMLRAATDLIADRGSLPGSYRVSVNTTRFTCRRRRLARPSQELKATAVARCRALAMGQGNIDWTTLKVLVSGVKINGRPYRIGSHCEISVPVARSNPGLAGDISTFKVATVHKFYTLWIRDEEVVFVELSTHKEKSMFQDIRIVRKNPKTRRRTLSVDCIRCRVKFVQHWDAETINQVCVVRMWMAL
jgi:hypothetical protein